MNTALQYDVLVQHPHGLHTRVAANVVQMAVDLAERTGVKLLVRRGAETVPADNLLALVGLGIRQGEAVILACEAGAEEISPEVLRSLGTLRGVMAGRNPAPDATAGSAAVDEIVHEATVTLDRLVENLANGLVVVNARNEIILFNKAAERYLGIPSAQALGQKADEIIPNSKLARVLQTGNPEMARLQVTGGCTLVTNRTPIRSEGRVIGAAAIFQDISELERLAGELKEVRALREKMNLVLDSVAECILVTNEKGDVAYSNPAFRRLFGDLPTWRPDGPIARVLRTGEPALAQLEVAPGGSQIVEDVRAIRIDGKMHGVVAIGRTTDVVRELARRVEHEAARADYLEQELVRVRPLASAFARLIGSSGTLRDALAVAAKAAASAATILIRGESGTGKDLAAEAIHMGSPRAKKPFVRLNCAAIPPTLVESELFGHEKGAFTGAVKRRLGKFELAHGGTIFLDEIGTLDPTVQAKLLRVLQNRELERVGGEEAISVDVRVIAATNADIEEMVRQGRFREDLYYRLNVISIYLPPLRERRSDVPLLVEHFIAKLSQTTGPTVTGITPDALRLMMDYDWPGNVRQLENVIERAVTLTDGPDIGVQDLPSYLYKPAAPCHLVNALPTGEIAPIEAYEREIIRMALEKYGSFNAAGKALGLAHRTVGLKARAYGLVPRI